jgi:hypothetical protein
MRVSLAQAGAAVLAALAVGFAAGSCWMYAVHIVGVVLCAR